MATATLQDTVRREAKRVFGWELAIHEPHNNDEGCVYLGCRYDLLGNQGYGIGNYSLERLAKILPMLPDWPTYEDGSEGAASSTWDALEPAKVSD